ncbi:Uncharacterized protein APZ42_031552 [Daphnia magna]|uniref:Tyr recombinase domain-containing protein n=1 Tax=Daphnia magna TaxID=35525 RepID=A0A162DB95_9CRUS|nr:Uncharacterized protein APZ42_031552 [Daphnia magna]
MAKAIRVAMKLWASLYGEVLNSRRRNILSQFYPEYLSLLDDPKLLECGDHLFGPRFMSQLNSHARVQTTLNDIRLVETIPARSQHRNTDEQQKPANANNSGSYRATTISTGEGNLQASITSKPNAKNDLSWWIKHAKFDEGKAIIMPTSDVSICTDASLLGAPSCSKRIRCFTAASFGSAVVLRIDNTAAVSYINNLGGSKSAQLCAVALKIFACRYGIKETFNGRKLEAKQIIIQSNPINLVVGDRPIRERVELLTPFIRQLVLSAEHSLEERVLQELERSSSVRLSTVRPHSELPIEDLPGPSGASPRNAILAEPSLVPDRNGTSDRNPAGTSSQAEPSHVPIGSLSAPYAERIYSVNRLSGVVSEARAFRTMLRTSCFPLQGKIHNLHTSPPGTLGAVAFKSGKSYSSINILRSMVSSTFGFGPLGPSEIGKHPLVVVTLMAITTLLRCTEIASIQTSSIVISATEASFLLGKPRKTQHTGPLTRISIPAWPRNESICPVACLKKYLSATDPVRNKSNASNLFISTTKPFQTVGSPTIGCWIKVQLQEAGIDTAVFKAHSTRDVAASKAASNGVPINIILKQGHWASEFTFAKFYHRETVKDSNPTGWPVLDQEADDTEES